MGHYCRFCNSERPNERFSGKGHRQHICKDCQKKPKIERDRIEINDELEGFLFNQSRISKKNKARLKVLMDHVDSELSYKAKLVYEVSLIAKGRKSRWKKVKESDPELLSKCLESGVLVSSMNYEMPYEYDGDYDY